MYAKNRKKRRLHSQKKKKDSSNDSTNTEFIGPFSLGVQFKSTWFCVPFSEI